MGVHFVGNKIYLVSDISLKNNQDIHLYFQELMQYV